MTKMSHLIDKQKCWSSVDILCRRPLSYTGALTHFTAQT